MADSPSFPMARQSFGISFALLARAWRHEIDSHLGEQGLSAATWVPMLHLSASGGGITQKDLARRTGVEAPSMVRQLEILEREGLIARRACPNDGRARLIDMTPEGVARLEELRRSLFSVEEKLLEGISDSQIADVLSVFETIRINIETANLQEGSDKEQ